MGGLGIWRFCEPVKVDSARTTAVHQPYSSQVFIENVIAGSIGLNLGSQVIESAQDRD